MLDRYYMLIDRLTNEFNNSLELDSEKKELVESFREYLEKRTITLLKPSPVQVNSSEFIEKRLFEITKELMELTCEQKKSFLLKDEALKKIRSLSLQLFDYAIKKNKDNNIKITEDKYNEILTVFDELFNLVKPYNKEEAMKLRSEGILDAKYLLEDESNIISIRLSRIYR